MVFPVLLSFCPVSIPIVHGFSIGADGSGTNGTARRGFSAAAAAPSRSAAAVAASMAAGGEVGGKVGGLVA